jgi:hypothetical protein
MHPEGCVAGPSLQISRLFQPAKPGGCNSRYLGSIVGADPYDLHVSTAFFWPLLLELGESRLDILPPEQFVCPGEIVEEEGEKVQGEKCRLILSQQ